MNRKLLSLIMLFCLLVCSSCYTITHPDPCPGLVETDLNSEKEVSAKILD